MSLILVDAGEARHRVYVYLDLMSGGYRWVLRSASGESVVRSATDYPSKALCLRSTEGLASRYPGAMVRDLTIREKLQ